MITYNPLLCLDFYKTCHAEQYPKGLTKMVSYYTPRMSRLGDTDKVTLFGLQAFIQEYLKSNSVTLSVSPRRLMRGV